MTVIPVDPCFSMLPERVKGRPLHAVELGSQNGYFAKRFLLNVPDSIIWCVDPWDLSQKKNLPTGVGTDQSTFTKWKENVKPWLGDRCHAIRNKSWLAEADFKDEIDFLYIDGDHRWWACYRDLCDWVPKVRSGGLVVGHDWTSNRWQNDIQKAVKLWLERDAPKNLELHHGIVTHSKIESFWFYKP